MKENYREVRRRALEFTARFGFITRDIFFEHICPLKRSRQYSSWADLQKESLIKPSKSYANIFYLTKKARAFCDNKAVPPRSVFFIEHDTHVARFYLNLKKSGFILNYWTEYDLKIDQATAFSVLGTDRLTKYPDLVVDLKSHSGTLRIAIEIERSRKTFSQYNQIAFSYVEAARIGFVIFACSTEANRRAIEQAFRGEYFEKAAKIPATLLLSNLEADGAEAGARFMNREMSLRKLVLAALKRPESDWNSGMDKTWKLVHDLSTQEKIAA